MSANSVNEEEINKDGFVSCDLVRDKLDCKIIIISDVAIDQTSTMESIVPVSAEINILCVVWDEVEMEV